MVLQMLKRRMTNVLCVSSSPFDDREIEEALEEERQPDPPLDLPDGSGLLSREQETALAYQIRAGGAAGKAAQDRFIECNLRLVYKVARTFLVAGEERGLDYEDLAQEGMIGLMRAVSKFEPERGLKFSTMATWWIRQAISRALDDQHSTIRIPVYRLGEVRRMLRIEQQVFQDLQRHPSDEELAAATGMTIDLIETLRELRKVIDLRSLDEKVSDQDEDLTLGSLLDDPAEETETQAVEQVASMALQATLEEVLTARERSVILLRYGFGGHHEHTLEEIGRLFQITRERVRQIEEKALRKLRYPHVARSLKEVTV